MKISLILLLAACISASYSLRICRPKTSPPPPTTVPPPPPPTTQQVQTTTVPDLVTKCLDLIAVLKAKIQVIIEAKQSSLDKTKGLISLINDSLEGIGSIVAELRAESNEASASALAAINLAIGSVASAVTQFRDSLSVIELNLPLGLGVGSNKEGGLGLGVGLDLGDLLGGDTVSDGLAKIVAQIDAL